MVTDRKTSDICCPTCHRPFEGEIDPRDLPVTGMQRVILRALPATIEELARLVYGSRDTGTDGQYDTLRVVIYRLRKELTPHGWTIDPRKSGRGNIKVYSLIRLPTV